MRFVEVQFNPYKPLKRGWPLNRGKNSRKALIRTLITDCLLGGWPFNRSPLFRGSTVIPKCSSSVVCVLFDSGAEKTLLSVK